MLLCAIDDFLKKEIIPETNPLLDLPIKVLDIDTCDAMLFDGRLIIILCRKTSTHADYKREAYFCYYGYTGYNQPS